MASGQRTVFLPCEGDVDHRSGVLPSRVGETGRCLQVDVGGEGLVGPQLVQGDHRVGVLRVRKKLHRSVAYKTQRDKLVIIRKALQDKGEVLRVERVAFVVHGGLRDGHGQVAGPVPDTQRSHSHMNTRAFAHVLHCLQETIGENFDEFGDHVVF